MPETSRWKFKCPRARGLIAKMGLLRRKAPDTWGNVLKVSMVGSKIWRRDLKMVETVVRDTRTWKVREMSAMSPESGPQQMAGYIVNSCFRLVDHVLSDILFCSLQLFNCIFCANLHHHLTAKYSPLHLRDWTQGDQWRLGSRQIHTYCEIFTNTFPFARPDSRRSMAAWKSANSYSLSMVNFTLSCARSAPALVGHRSNTLSSIYL